MGWRLTSGPVGSTDVNHRLLLLVCVLGSASFTSGSTKLGMPSLVAMPEMEMMSSSFQAIPTVGDNLKVPIPVPLPAGRPSLDEAWLRWRQATNKVGLRFFAALRRHGVPTNTVRRLQDGTKAIERQAEAAVSASALASILADEDQFTFLEQTVDETPLPPPSPSQMPPLQQLHQTKSMPQAHSGSKKQLDAHSEATIVTISLNPDAIISTSAQKLRNDVKAHRHEQRRGVNPKPRTPLSKNEMQSIPASTSQQPETTTGLIGGSNASAIVMQHSKEAEEDDYVPFLYNIVMHTDNSMYTCVRGMDHNPCDGMLELNGSEPGGRGVFGTTVRHYANAATSAIEVITGICAGVGAVVLFLLTALAVKRCRAFQLQSLFLDSSATLSQMKASCLAARSTTHGRPREINRSSVTLLTKQGQGAFGEVWKACLDESSDRDVPPFTCAIKIIKDAHPDNIQQLTEEAALMAGFDHPNVISLIGVVTPKMIVMPFCKNGDLHSFLQRKAVALDCKAQISICRDVASGMAYLADRNLVHRDLAARNILIADDFTCKVSDFGMSRQVDKSASEYYRSVKGQVPVRWTAPEALQDRKFTEKSDVWAYGVLCYEVFTATAKPYETMSNDMVIIRVSAGYRLTRPADCPRDVYSKLMIQCWNANPALRPTFAGLRALPMLAIQDDVGTKNAFALSIPMHRHTHTPTSSGGFRSNTSHSGGGNTGGNYGGSSRETQPTIGGSDTISTHRHHPHLGTSPYLSLEGASGVIIEADQDLESPVCTARVSHAGIITAGDAQPLTRTLQSDMPTLRGRSGVRGSSLRRPFSFFAKPAPRHVVSSV